MTWENKFCLKMFSFMLSVQPNNFYQFQGLQSMKISNISFILRRKLVNCIVSTSPDKLAANFVRKRVLCINNWDPINSFNPRHILFQSPARNWSTNLICRAFNIFQVYQYFIITITGRPSVVSFLHFNQLL